MNIKTITAFLCAAMTIATAAAQTAEGIQQKIETIVNGDVLGEAVVGVCARTGDGRTLVDINAGDMLVPASNMKLISTGTALHSLGGKYRYKTSVAYDGNIVDGVLIGDLYIVGGGDPTVGSKDSIAAPVEHTFALWERLIRISLSAR